MGTTTTNPIIKDTVSSGFGQITPEFLMMVAGAAIVLVIVLLSILIVLLLRSGRSGMKPVKEKKSKREEEVSSPNNAVQSEYVKTSEHQIVDAPAAHVQTEEPDSSIHEEESPQDLIRTRGSERPATQRPDKVSAGEADAEEVVAGGSYSVVSEKMNPPEEKTEDTEQSNALPKPDEHVEAVSAPAEISPEVAPQAAAQPVVPETPPVAPAAPAEEDATSPAQSAVQRETNTLESDISDEVAEIRRMDQAIDLLSSSRGRAQEAGKQKKVSGSNEKKKANARREEKALKKRSRKLRIPKTAQNTIPYYAVYEQDGIIEIQPGTFTKSYALSDVNYKIAKMEEQQNMFAHYGEFLNGFDPSARFEITINQRNVNMEEFERETMLPMKDDGLDHLRKEQNDRLKKRIKEGRNSRVKEKYLTVSITAPDITAAHNIFARLDSEISTNIAKIGRATAVPLSAAQRLEILHDCYNVGYEGCFGNNVITGPDGAPMFDPNEKFKFEYMTRMGLTTKDMIAPDVFKFRTDHGQIGETFFRALYVKKLPSFLLDDVLEKLTDTDCNMITSLQYEPVDGERALKMARNQMTRINANVIDKQKAASKAGYSPDLISPDLMDASQEAAGLLGDLTNKNQKLFLVTFVIVHFADSKETLDSDTKTIQGIGRTAVIDIRPLLGQQELGLNSALPLAYNQLEIKRSLTTESAAVFMPFTNQELNDRKGGMFYGNNAISHNLIMFNRRNLKNGNGFIFGTPGSGKSMSAKQEMLTVLLSSDDSVVVIDPEGEYYPMAEMLGGEVIRVAAGGDVHINPFDLDMHYDSDDDPISFQSDFITSLCETVAADRFGLTAAQRSIIDRCVRKCYEPYLGSLDPKTGEYDKNLLPTFVDFYEHLREQSGYEAMNLADGLEMYVTGSLNFFAHRTNVEYKKRFVVYDIKDIGSNMKAMGLLVVLNNIWNQIVAGRQEGKNTWFFIDEIYLLFKNESSAEFLRQLYKRARKYGGIPTGITQNVSDLLENDIARTMITNSEYLLMLNQGQMDRAELGRLISMSPTELEYVTNAQPGHGILYNGVVKVPFENQLPKDTMMYTAMTTKLDEVKQRDENQQLAKAIEASKSNQAQEPSGSADE